MLVTAMATETATMVMSATAAAAWDGGDNGGAEWRRSSSVGDSESDGGDVEWRRSSSVGDSESDGGDVEWRRRGGKATVTAR